MTSRDFFDRMVDLEEEGNWVELEHLFEQDHSLLPGERECFLVLVSHERVLGHQLIVQLDLTGLHVVRK